MSERNCYLDLETAFSKKTGTFFDKYLIVVVCRVEFLGYHGDCTVWKGRDDPIRERMERWKNRCGILP
jgi:hypothetical protein